VRDILVDPNDAAIAKMIIALATTLGLEVLAEGVETEAQRQALTDLGCLFYQGYLFAPAIPEREFDRFRSDFQEPLRQVGLSHPPALLERRPRLRVLSS
jgi:EAL domain-containing protein (putative c-di-GMP-specific phosphodiesterase class I)